MIYDFLISGMLTAALVPVLSEYAGRRDEFWRLVSVLLALTALLMGAIVLGLEILAPQVAWIMAGGFDAA
ncbi:MAG TPA: murein biosynthesis integral membrane protein MurJ, partial [Acidobacteriota bacterium]|nr:murein biosynthesis integral membrane protein MurJ [Acidobacteriota bacterium]